MPLALGLSGGGNGLISSSLAITVVGGLATSTFLTLLVVPVGYSLLKSGPRRKGKKG
jgi:hydrophobic/amphiphilic exporter-1 (mainly G- bacteria), HAE1 family